MRDQMRRRNGKPPSQKAVLREMYNLKPDCKSMTFESFKTRFQEAKRHHPDVWHRVIAEGGNGQRDESVRPVPARTPPKRGKGTKLRSK